ncbi:MAG: beta-galactosidase [Kiritimatiellia bacterium]
MRNRLLWLVFLSGILIGAANARTLLPPDALSVLERSNGAAALRSDSNGGQTLVIRSAKATPHAWDLQTSIPLAERVGKGDWITVRFALRGKAAYGDGRIAVKLQDRAMQPLLREEPRGGTDWKCFRYERQAKQDYAAGELVLVLFLGLERQVVEMRGLEVFSSAERLPSAPAKDWANADDPELVVPPAPEHMQLPPLKKEALQKKRYVILKLDDVTSGGKDGGVHPAIKRVADDLEARRIPAAFGVICRTLPTGSPAYIDWFKRTDYRNGGLFEFWQHGWDHGMNVEFKGKRYPAEFAVPDETYQRKYFEDAQKAFLERTGKPLEGFCAPCGNVTEITRKLLREHPEIRSWLYPEPNSDYAGKFPFLRTASLESSVGRIAYDEFLGRYKNHREDALLTLQGHPALWNDESWAHFKLILEQLKRDGWIFTTPAQYLNETGADRRLPAKEVPENGIFFPVSMGGNDSNCGVADLSWLNAEGITPLHVDKEGHIVNEKGRRVRLFGTNLTFGGCFPSEEESPRLAKRLASMGINAVRIHHHDKELAPSGIWKKTPDGKRATFDPVQMRRLDKLLYELSRNGIYVDLNLHVSRMYWNAIDLPDGIRNDRERDAVLPKYGKALDKIFRPYIDLQKQFVKDYLGHLNPFTGRTYASDPMVAIVEINNENTLMDLQPEKLPAYYAEAVRTLWNAWLEKRYGNEDALVAAWGAELPLGDNLIRRAAVAEGPSYLDVRTDAEGVHAQQKGKPAHSWGSQLQWLDCKVEEGKLYTLQFEAWASSPVNVHVNARQQGGAYGNCGLSEQINLKQEPQIFSFAFTARSVLERTRIDIPTSGLAVGTIIHVRNISLRPGGVSGLAKGESLEKGTIGFIGNRASGTKRGLDWRRFLAQQERVYGDEMAACVRAIGYPGILFDSQASYGGLHGLLREARYDMIDMHSYWQHPSFPGGGWSSSNWTLSNIAMSEKPEEGANLGALARTRVKGMPFSVTEYDHPAPNEFASEALAMLGSYAAWQDWDALFQFDWGNPDEKPGFVNTFFSLNWHPAKLALVPVASLLFRGEAMPVAGMQSTLVLPAAEPDETALRWHRVPEAWKQVTNSLPVGVDGRLGIRLDRTADAKQSLRVEHAGTPLKDATIQWTAGKPYQAVSQRAALWSGLLGGVLDSAPVAPGFRFETEADVPRFGTVALVTGPRNQEELVGSTIGNASRYLLVACGRWKNTDMGWNEAKTTVGTKWGHAPTLCETVPGTAFLEVGACPSGKVWQVWALDGKGKRKVSVAASSQNGVLSFRVKPEHETVWYELVLAPIQAK